MAEKPEDAKKATTKDKLKALETRYTEIVKQLATKSQAVEDCLVVLKEGLTEAGVSTDHITPESDVVEVAKTLTKVMAAKVKSLKADIDSVKEERFDADSKNKSFKQEIERLKTDNSDLLTVLKHKEFEIGELKRINESLKAEQNDPILSRFSSISQPTGPTRAADGRDEEISRLKAELDEAYNKVDSLESQLVGSKKPQKSTTGCQTEETAFKTASIEARLLAIAPARDEDEESSKAYLKNLIIRYMVYEAKRNEVEVNVIRRAILDCVGVGSEDRALIDDAINNRGGIKDAVYFLKLFGGQ